jgi:hypothetical protein
LTLELGTEETGDSDDGRTAPRVELALSRLSNMTHSASFVEKSSAPPMGGRAISSVLHLFKAVSDLPLLRLQSALLLQTVRRDCTSRKHCVSPA